MRGVGLQGEDARVEHRIIGQLAADDRTVMRAVPIGEVFKQLRPLAVIPVGEISMATAFPSQSDWILRLRWQENSAEFIFDGLFSERRARLAEAGLRHLIQQKEQSPAAATRAKAAGA